MNLTTADFNMENFAGFITKITKYFWLHLISGTSQMMLLLLFFVKQLRILS